MKDQLVYMPESVDLSKIIFMQRRATFNLKENLKFLNNFRKQGIMLNKTA